MKSHSDLKTLRWLTSRFWVAPECEVGGAPGGPTSTLTDVSIARVATCSEVLAHSQENTPVSSRAVVVSASLPTSLALLSMS